MCSYRRVPSPELISDILEKIVALYCSHLNRIHIPHRFPYDVAPHPLLMPADGSHLRAHSCAGHCRLGMNVFFFALARLASQTQLQEDDTVEHPYETDSYNPDNLDFYSTRELSTSHRLIPHKHNFLQNCRSASATPDCTTLSQRLRRERSGSVMQ